MGRAFEAVGRTALEMDHNRRKPIDNGLDNGDRQGSGEKNGAARATIGAEAARKGSVMRRTAQCKMIVRGRRGVVFIRALAAGCFCVVMRGGNRRMIAVVRRSGDVERIRRTAVSRTAYGHGRSDRAPDRNGRHQQ